MPEVKPEFVVEFYGSKGWEVAYEGDESATAWGAFDDLQDAGIDPPESSAVRLTVNKV